MKHDYKRHGTTTLFATLSVLDGTVIGRCMQRHRHIEFIRFLNAIEREVPAGKVIHTVLDNYATPGRPNSKKRDRSSRSCGGADRERLSAVYAVRSVILFGTGPLEPTIRTTKHIATLLGHTREIPISRGSTPLNLSIVFASESMIF